MFVGLIPICTLASAPLIPVIFGHLKAMANLSEYRSLDKFRLSSREKELLEREIEGGGFSRTH
jgi:hypothetical protein